MAKPVRWVTYTGTEERDEFTGGAYGDQIYGLGGDDELHGGDGGDDIRGGSGDDWIYGEGGSDPVLMGHEGNDHIFGGEGDDALFGQEGNDLLHGGAGNDLIGSGPGNDTLTGGQGADRFSMVSNWDVGMNVHTITDFNRSEADYIDMKGIDADGISSNNTRKGNTDFTVVSSPTGAAGEAWMAEIRDPLTGAVSGTSIYLNTDSDPEADTRIDVLGVTDLRWGVDILG